MHTVTKTFAVCTPRELKEHHPAQYKREFENWQRDQCQDNWWDCTYEDFKENTHMYTPAVRDYFKNYPPASWPDKSWPDELEQLTKAWEGVLHFEDKPVDSFDLYPKEITLGAVRMDVRRFLKLTNFTWEAPFALDALMQDIPTYAARIDTAEPLNEYMRDFRALAEEFLFDTFGVPQSGSAPDFNSDAVALADQMVDCFDAIQDNIVTFLESVGDEVLRVLDAEYDHLQSEECFLEQDHLEIEVEVNDEQLHTV